MKSAVAWVGVHLGRALGAHGSGDDEMEVSVGLTGNGGAAGGRW